jgi:very-short-patch-repair endonuclease
MGIHRFAKKRKQKFAKKLRRRLTRAEREFWEMCRTLRDEEGVHFWRQIVLCGYVADFWCPKLKLVVEIDGPSHLTEAAQAYDKRRAKVMADELGAKTIRFTNREVFIKRASVEYRFREAVRQRQAELGKTS